MLPREIVIGGTKIAITGRTKTKKGYIACFVRGHPNAGKDRRVFEHRLVAEFKIGRFLEPDECVHHINGIKSDNRPENLQVMKHSYHTKITHTGLKRPLETRLKVSMKAKMRYRDKRNHPSYTDIPKEEMINYYRQFGATRTAEKYGVTKRTIYNRLHEWGVKLKNAK